MISRGRKNGRRNRTVRNGRGGHINSKVNVVWHYWGEAGGREAWYGNLWNQQPFGWEMEQGRVCICIFFKAGDDSQKQGTKHLTAETFQVNIFQGFRDHSSYFNGFGLREMSTGLQKVNQILQPITSCHFKRNHLEIADKCMQTFGIWVMRIPDAPRYFCRFSLWLKQQDSFFSQ